MSHLKINRLIIKTKTSDGFYGADLKFNDGLNIISAENSFGKSTCIQSIVYALGLEGTLGASRKNPLKSALTTKLKNNNSIEVSVIITEVFLEISNASGNIITVLRKSDEEASKLVSVYDCAYDKIANSGLDIKSDFFLKDAGSASRERGFHFFLSNFLGIVQPEVVKYDGTKCPLYLESIFSINYVEQTRGWGGILNVIPTYLGIKDLSQNIIEYTLNLDVSRIRRKREHFLDKKKNLEVRWENSINELVSKAKNYGYFLSNRIPEKLNIKSEIYNDSDLYSFDKEKRETYLNNDIITLREELNELNKEHAPSINENIISDKLSRRIEDLSLYLVENENAAATLISDFDNSQQYLNSISKSITDVKESLRKYKDIEKLQQLGSEEEFSFIRGLCPTCNQSVIDNLLPDTDKNRILSTSENIKYLEKTLNVFEDMKKSEWRKTESKKSNLQIINERIKSIRHEIRSIRKSLISSDDIATREKIRREIELENKIDRLCILLQQEKEIKDSLQAIIIEWKESVSALDRLPYDGFSSKDREKLSLLENSFKHYLKKFGYKSTSIEHFEISKQTYKPSIDGVDLGSEASASDNIRVIWSYLYSMLMLDTFERDIITNHLGLLILDEPRQQETKDVNFKTFIETTTNTYSVHKQVIIGTSEKFQDLLSMIEGLNVNLLHFDKNIIEKL
ncbi:TPA: hypothetical protein SMI16_003735 [Serratia liquefaciens]|nr:hypothetical protein [Serratia liquefaciens]